MRRTIVKGLGVLAGAAGCAALAQAADLPLRTAPPAFTAADPQVSCPQAAPSRSC